MTEKNYDYDFIIIGSGFGGSVSAMRLAQKGYSVAVLESGKRYRPHDFPKTNWNLRKNLWMPGLFLYGIWRFKLIKDVLIMAGAGVGGGSMNYANTLYIPFMEFFKNNTIKKMGGKKGLLPYYELAKKMLGAVENPELDVVDDFMKDTAKEFGADKTFKPTQVGVYIGEPDIKVPDPYFMGDGPDRTGCNFCGGCMVGCRFDAKNTLDKNYLYLAEKLGAEIISETKVTEIIPLSEDGSKGYEIITKNPCGFFGLPKKKYRAKNIVASAGVLGTVNLFLKMKEKGRLPNLSHMLGSIVRTNSESIIGVTSKSSKVDFSKGVAITSSVYPDENTHIEPVRFSKGSDALGALCSPALTDDDGGKPRWVKYIIAKIKNPFRTLRWIIPFGFAQRTIILLVMQTLDNQIKLLRKRSKLWPFSKLLLSDYEEGFNKIPTYIPIANKFARVLAKKIDGFPASSLTELIFNIPMTAHILGGCCMGENRDEGVIDFQNRVFGYENMWVVDGSMIPANLGVNPSLSITAISERAMAFIPPSKKTGKKGMRIFNFEKKWKVVKDINKF